MVMRGSPATGVIRRISCGGRKIRSKRGKRGAKSVMRTRPPWRSSSSVSRMAVLRAYPDFASTRSATTTSQNPFSSSPASRRQNTGLKSNAGKHHQTMRPTPFTSAAIRQLPMSARSSARAPAAGSEGRAGALIPRAARPRPAPPPAAGTSQKARATAPRPRRPSRRAPARYQSRHGPSGRPRQKPDASRQKARSP
jgi:hypothetical protein